MFYKNASDYLEKMTPNFPPHPETYQGLPKSQYVVMFLPSQIWSWRYFICLSQIWMEKSVTVAWTHAKQFPVTYSESAPKSRKSCRSVMLVTLDSLALLSHTAFMLSSSLSFHTTPLMFTSRHLLFSLIVFGKFNLNQIAVLLKRTDPSRLQPESRLFRRSVSTLCLSPQTHGTGSYREGKIPLYIRTAFWPCYSPHSETRYVSLLPVCPPASPTSYPAFSHPHHWAHQI